MKTRMQYNFDCCGIAELASIYASKTPEEALMKVHEYVDDQAVVVFSDAQGYAGDGSGNYSGMGKKLFDYIKSHRLGTVVTFKQVENPNSGNLIKAYLWRVNRKRLEEWGDAEMAKQKQNRCSQNPWANGAAAEALDD